MSKSKTKTPSVGNLFKDKEEDYFEYTPSRDIRKYLSPKTSREFKKIIVELEPSEEDDLGIYDLLKDYEPSFANEEARKELRFKLSNDRDLISYFFSELLLNKFDDICIGPVLQILKSRCKTNICENMEFIVRRNKIVSLINDYKKKIRSYYNHESKIEEEIEDINKVLSVLEFFNNKVSDFFKDPKTIYFKNKCKKRYILFPIDTTYFENEYDMKRHATFIFFDKEARNGYYIDPTFVNDDDDETVFNFEIIRKAQYYIHLLLYSDIELNYLNSLYQDFCKNEEQIDELEPIDTVYRTSTEIFLVRYDSPQCLTKDSNCLFWSMFLTDLILLNFNPEKGYTPFYIIGRVREIYPKAKQLETILLKYVAYLAQRFEIDLEKEEESISESKNVSSKKVAYKPSVSSPYRSKTKSKTKTVSPSRTKNTPKIGNFFGKDEEYFEYTPVPKSKTKTKTKSKTISPKLNFLYGEEEDF